MQVVYLGGDSRKHQLGSGSSKKREGKETEKRVHSQMSQLESSHAGEFRVVSLRQVEARVLIH